MKTEFNPTEKKKRNAKISIILSVSILLMVFISTIISVLQKDINKFQLFCLLPWLILLTPLSIADDRFRINHEKILLSPNGIDYRAFAYEVSAEWNELKMIEKDPALLSNLEWIITDSKKIKNKLLLWQLLRWERRNYIPVYLFAENWRDSELGQQIKQYAPHLFEKEKSA